MGRRCPWICSSFPLPSFVMVWRIRLDSGFSLSSSSWPEDARVLLNYPLQCFVVSLGKPECDLEGGTRGCAQAGWAPLETLHTGTLSCPPPPSWLWHGSPIKPAAGGGERLCQLSSSSTLPLGLDKVSFLFIFKLPFPDPSSRSRLGLSPDEGQFCQAFPSPPQGLSF